MVSTLAWRIGRATFLCMGVLLSVFILAQYAFAQDAGAVMETGDVPEGVVINTLPEQEQTPEGLVSCFEYYDFGSVAVTPELELVAVTPGSTISVQTTIENANDYPIVDGMVYVKVFRQRNTEKDLTGPDVKDQFVALENLTFKAKEIQKQTFEWTIPADAENGNYSFATFFVSAGRFNLQGLTFTDDIVGGVVDFSVVGQEENGSVRFDRENVTLNGQTYHFTTFIPRFDETTKRTHIEAQVQNTTDRPYRGEVVWRFYGWDGLRAETLLNEETQVVKVHPQDTATLRYDSTVGLNSPFPVHYVVAELTDGVSKSIINMRFSHERPGKGWARFNDVAVNRYPLSEDTIAFACFHGFSGTPNDNPPGRVEVKVTSPSLFGERVLAEGEYEGRIPYAISALPVAIPLGVTANQFTVSATLYVRGELIDTVDMKYSCEALQPDSCSSTDGTSSLLITLLLLVLAGGAIALYGNMRRKTPSEDTGGVS